MKKFIEEFIEEI